jgi:nucleotide-binding universal stress UspA family protein
MRTLDTILAPLDGSDNAESVLPYIALLANASNSRVRLLTVARDGSGREEARTYLEAVRSRLGRVGVFATTEVTVGDPAGAIVETAERHAVSLLAMTTYGQSGPERWVLGSVAYRVISATAPPVLLVRPSGLEEDPKAVIRSLIVALDGSPLAEAGVLQAEALARPLESQIHLVTVVPNQDEGAAGVERTTDSDAEYLRRIAHRLELKGLTASWTVRRGAPAIEIATLGQETHDTIIVMTTHGASGDTGWIMGSVTDKVLRSSVRPVLVVHPEIQK